MQRQNYSQIADKVCSGTRYLVLVQDRQRNVLPFDDPLHSALELVRRSRGSPHLSTYPSPVT
jgi:hypothetical protein